MHPLRLFSVAAASLALLAVGLTAPFKSHAQIGSPNVWGANQSGQVGDGTVNNASSPVSLKKLTGVIQVAGGDGHSLALKSNGAVLVWGRNDGGQLGDGTKTDRNAPFQIPNFKQVVQIAAGNAHSLALKSDGTVWAWGDNFYGQLGDGSFTSKSAPVQVAGLTKAVQVAAGTYHSIALKSDGTVWIWGSDKDFQLGKTDRLNRNAPVQVAGLKGVIQVAGGTYHSMALKSDGTIWIWGTSYSGQLGHGHNLGFLYAPTKMATLSGVARIVAGPLHSLALKFDGTVWAWGAGDKGQIGNGSSADVNVPTQATGISSAVQIAAGGKHSLAALADGTVESWGENAAGQLGDGTTADRNSPAAIPSLSLQTFIAAGGKHSFSLIAQKQDVKIATADMTQQYGKPVILTGALRNSLTGMPILQEPAIFNLDGADLGTSYTDAAGKTTFVAPNPTQYKRGVHPFTLLHAENGLYNASAPAAATLTILKADVFIAYAPVSAVYGQKAPLLVTLKRRTDGAKLAGANLTYTLDGVKIGVATTDGSGRATLSYYIPDSLALGARTLAIDYGGDDNHNASNLSSTLKINKASATILLNNAAGAYGKTISLTGLLRRNSDKARLANQTVSLKVDGVAAGSAVTDSKGLFALKYKVEDALTPGAHALVAEFAGNDKCLAASASAALTANKADTGALPLDVAGAYGQTVKLTATLSRLTDKGKLAGQTIVFSVDGVAAGEAKTDATGKAAVNYFVEDALTPGAHAIKADYAGVERYNPSSGSATLTAKQASSKIVVANASAARGETVNLVAKLKRTSDGKALSAKTVVFRIDGADVGTATTDSEGAATFSYVLPSDMTLGKHPLAVSFGGDVYYLASLYEAGSLTVK